MTEQELELKLLLLDSGELPDAEAAELTELLLQHPEWQQTRDALNLLQQAGRFASDELVPDTPELIREKILAAQPSHSPLLPRLLAVAAGLVLAIGVLPHIQNTSPSSQDNTLVSQYNTPTPEAVTSTALAEVDPVLDSLEALDQELDSLLSGELTSELASDLTWGDENDWASELLESEEAI